MNNQTTIYLRIAAIFILVVSLKGCALKNCLECSNISDCKTCQKGFKKITSVGTNGVTYHMCSKDNQIEWPLVIIGLVLLTAFILLLVIGLVKLAGKNKASKVPQGAKGLIGAKPILTSHVKAMSPSEDVVGVRNLSRSQKKAFQRKRVAKKAQKRDRGGDRGDLQHEVYLDTMMSTERGLTEKNQNEGQGVDPKMIERVKDGNVIKDKEGSRTNEIKVASPRGGLKGRRDRPKSLKSIIVDAENTQLANRLNKEPSPNKANQQLRFQAIHPKNAVLLKKPTPDPSYQNNELNVTRPGQGDPKPTNPSMEANCMSQIISPNRSSRYVVSIVQSPQRQVYATPHNRHKLFYGSNHQSPNYRSRHQPLLIKQPNIPPNRSVLPRTQKFDYKSLFQNISIRQPEGGLVCIPAGHQYLAKRFRNSSQPISPKRGQFSPATIRKFSRPGSPQRITSITQFELFNAKRSSFPLRIDQPKSSRLREVRRPPKIQSSPLQAQCRTLPPKHLTSKSPRPQITKVVANCSFMQSGIPAPQKVQRSPKIEFSSVIRIKGDGLSPERNDLWEKGDQSQNQSPSITRRKAYLPPAISQKQPIQNSRADTLRLRSPQTCDKNRILESEVVKVCVDFSGTKLGSPSKEKRISGSRVSQRTSLKDTVPRSGKVNNRGGYMTQKHSPSRREMIVTQRVSCSGKTKTKQKVSHQKTANLNQYQSKVELENSARNSEGIQYRVIYQEQHEDELMARQRARSIGVFRSKRLRRPSLLQAKLSKDLVSMATEDTSDHNQTRNSSDGMGFLGINETANQPQQPGGGHNEEEYKETESVYNLRQVDEDLKRRESISPASSYHQREVSRRAERGDGAQKSGSNHPPISRCLQSCVQNKGKQMGQAAEKTSKKLIRKVKYGSNLNHYPQSYTLKSAGGSQKPSIQLRQHNRSLKTTQSRWLENIEMTEVESNLRRKETHLTEGGAQIAKKGALGGPSGTYQPSRGNSRVVISSNIVTEIKDNNNKDNLEIIQEEQENSPNQQKIEQDKAQEALNGYQESSSIVMGSFVNTHHSQSKRNYLQSQLTSNVETFTEGESLNLYNPPFSESQLLQYQTTKVMQSSLEASKLAGALNGGNDSDLRRSINAENVMTMKKKAMISFAKEEDLVHKTPNHTQGPTLMRKLNEVSTRSQLRRGGSSEPRAEEGQESFNIKSKEIRPFDEISDNDDSFLQQLRQSSGDELILKNNNQQDFFVSDGTERSPLEANFMNISSSSFNNENLSLYNSPLRRTKGQSQQAKPQLGGRLSSIVEVNISDEEMNYNRDPELNLGNSGRYECQIEKRNSVRHGKFANFYG